MSSQHKRPLLAFVAVALLCGFVLGNAARGQAMGALAQVVPQVVVVTRVDKIAPLVAAGGAAVVSRVDDARRESAEDVLLPVAAKASAPAMSDGGERTAAREGRSGPVETRADATEEVRAEPGDEDRRDAREAREDAREERREDRDRAREDRRESRDERREDRREARDERREDRREAREDRRDDREAARRDLRERRDEAREDRREAREDRRDQAREDRRDRRDQARGDRRERRDEAREDRRERRDQDRRDRGRSHRR